jgi:hypothetical protein
VGALWRKLTDRLKNSESHMGLNLLEYKAHVASPALFPCTRLFAERGSASLIALRFLIAADKLGLHAR